MCTDAATRFPDAYDPDAALKPPGLFRTRVAGKPALLSQVFGTLRTSPWRSSVSVPGRPGLFTAFVPIDGNEGGTWEFTNFDDKVYVVISDCSFSKAREETVLSEGYVEFHYALTGSARAGQTPVHSLDLVVCSLGSDATYVVHCDRGRRVSVAIFLRREYFVQYLDPQASFTSTVQRDLASIGPCDVYLRRISLEFSQAQLVRQLVDNPYRDSRRLQFAEAKVAELVCMSLDLWAGGHMAREGSMALSPRDVRLLHEARRLITSELHHSYTIAQISRRVGTNSSKLKAGFRLLFGCTVFEFVTRTRMEHALQQLSVGECSIADVATSIGYQHASSFSAAFQRFFSFSPKQARHAAAPSAQDAARVTSATSNSGLYARSMTP